MHPLEIYLRDIRATGAAVKETSYYPPLANLLNAVGQTLKPRVRCVINLKNQGAGMPDGGLFTPDQFPKGTEEPLAGQQPSRGATECKGTREDAWVTAETRQVTKYWGKYHQVLVTNFRDFVLVGQESDRQPVIRETFRLASSDKAFWAAAANPTALVASQGARFLDYLKRVLLQPAALADPKDVAWFLVSYAREDRLEGQLADRERQEREQPLAQLRRFITSAARVGGVSAPLSMSFLKRGSKDIRVDLEVIKGLACLPASRSGKP